MDKLEQKLLPCPNPWCERAFPPRAIRHRGGPRVTGPWRVHCEDCELRGPIAEVEAEAIAAWNTRPSPQHTEVTPEIPRFFIDHGMIHDRVTGKHVSTEPIEVDEGQFDTSPVSETCDLLNALAMSRPSP